MYFNILSQEPSWFFVQQQTIANLPGVLRILLHPLNSFGQSWSKATISFWKTYNSWTTVTWSHLKSLNSIFGPFGNNSVISAFSVLFCCSALFFHSLACNSRNLHAWWETCVRCIRPWTCLKRFDEIENESIYANLATCKSYTKMSCWSAKHFRVVSITNLALPCFTLTSFIACTLQRIACLNGCA